MYKSTITVFNKKPGARGQGDTWYPTVIKNVNIIIDRAAIVAKYGQETQDNAILNVRYKILNGEIMVAEKPWSPPKEWDGTEDSITFASGDFFWKGEWTGGIISDEGYGDEGFYAYMNRIHDFVFSISSVAILSVIPHFEIMGK